MNSLELLISLWPLFIGFITLVIVLAQMYMRIQVLEEKVKVAFELINKLNSK
jgi:hypothetical protein